MRIISKRTCFYSGINNTARHLVTAHFLTIYKRLFSKEHSLETLSKMQALGNTFDNLTKVRISLTNYSYYPNTSKYYLNATIKEIRPGQDFQNSSLLEVGKSGTFVIDPNQYDLQNSAVADYFANHLENDLHEAQLVVYVDEHIEPRAENIPKYAPIQTRNRIPGSFNTKNLGCLRI